MAHALRLILVPRCTVCAPYTPSPRKRSHDGQPQLRIARSLGVTFNTVRSQVQAVHAKFEVSRTAELVALIHSVSFGTLR